MTKLTMHLISALVLLGLCATTVTAQRAEVEYRDSKGNLRKDSVTVVSHDWSGLTMKRSRNASDKLVNSDDVMGVTYSRRPDGFDDAKALMAQGAWRNAAAAFTEVVTNLKSNRFQWARQECLYHIAEANLRGDNLAGYETAVAELNAAVPKNRFIPTTDLHAAEHLYAFGEFAKAATAFQKVNSEGKQRQYAPSILARAQAGRIQALIDDKKNADAASAISAASSGASAATKLRLDALNARILLAKNDLSGARSAFRSLFNKGKNYAKTNASGDRFALAAGATGLGDVLFAEEKFQLAAVEYSKAFALFGDDPELSQVVGWAKWKFAKSYSRLANDAKDDETRRFQTIRFNRMREEVATENRFTRGGQLARRELALGR